MPKKYLFLALILVALLVAACGEKDEASSSSSDNTTDQNTTTGSTDDLVAPDTSIFGPEFDVLDIPTQTVAPGAGTLVLNVTMPNGYKLNDSAPFTGVFTSDGTSVAVDEEWVDYQEVTPDLPLEIPVTFSEGEATLTANLTIYWCEGVNYTLCFIDRHELHVPVVVSPDAEAPTASAALALVPPE